MYSLTSPYASMVVMIQKYLTSGIFYWYECGYCVFNDSSFDHDITARLQLERLSSSSIGSLCLDKRFCWNEHLLMDMFVNESSKYWLTTLIQGWIGTGECLLPVDDFVPVSKTLSISIICRASRYRVGGTKVVWGIDDDGNVSHCAETEQILVASYDDVDLMSSTSKSVHDIVSMVQIRGSVPIFYHLITSTIGKSKVRLMRSSSVSAPAFNRHFSSLYDNYGPKIVFADLLSKASNSEQVLSVEYYLQFQRFMEQCGAMVLRQPRGYTAQPSDLMNDDGVPPPPPATPSFHSVDVLNLAPRFKITPDLVPSTMEEDIRGGGYFWMRKEISRDGKENVMQFALQNGVIRSNCRDCTDRSSVFQSAVALRELESQLRAIAGAQLPPALATLHTRLWEECNIAIVKIFNSRATTAQAPVQQPAHASLAGAGREWVDESMKSIKRWISGPPPGAAPMAVPTTERTDVIDVLLGKRSLGISNDPLRSTSITEVINVVLRQKERLFTKNGTLSIHIATWNLNGIPPSDVVRDSPLVELFMPSDEENLTPADVYVIGFQEIVDLDAVNVLINVDTLTPKIWDDNLKQALSTLVTANYWEPYVQLTAPQQLVGVCMYTFVKRSLVTHIRDVYTDIVKVGFGTSRIKAGNKGAVAISFKVHDSSLCIVCTHMAAGQRHVEERNADYHEIKNSLTFGPDARGVFDHDAVFWFGDLNYRIDLERATIETALRERDYMLLQEKDQLSVQRRTGRAFAGFVEGGITFEPTYKYDVGSNIYDSGEKQRPPAWCDRVLYWCVEYGRQMTTTRRSSELMHDDLMVFDDDDKQPVAILPSPSPRTSRHDDSDDEVDAVPVKMPVEKSRSSVDLPARSPVTTTSNLDPTPKQSVRDTMFLVYPPPPSPDKPRHVHVPRKLPMPPPRKSTENASDNTSTSTPPPLPAESVEPVMQPMPVKPDINPLMQTEPTDSLFDFSLDFNSKNDSDSLLALRRDNRASSGPPSMVMTAPAPKPPPPSFSEITKAPQNTVLLMHYGRKELMSSDHRPVVGVFEMTTKMYSNSKKIALESYLRSKFAATASVDSRNEVLSSLLNSNELDEWSSRYDGATVVTVSAVSPVKPQELQAKDLLDFDE